MTDEPTRWTADPSWEHGGDRPLDDVYAHAVEGHWHYVGYGPIRLTFRLPSDGSQPPPSWPVDLLQELARDVVVSGEPYAAGHLARLGRPIAEGSELTTVGFTMDSQLGLDFLQVVGLTDDEYATALAWLPKSFLAALEKRVPLLVTDPGRSTLLADITLTDEVAKGIARDGSSIGMVTVEGLEVSSEPGGMSITLPRVAVDVVADAIEARLPHGRALRLEDGLVAVTLVVGGGFDLVDEETDVTAEVPDEAVERLVRFLSSRTTGSFEPVPGLTIHVT